MYGKKSLSFRDFGGFGGVYSGSEGSWGNGYFGKLFLKDVRGKIRNFPGFREVFLGKICIIGVFFGQWWGF